MQAERDHRYEYVSTIKGTLYHHTIQFLVLVLCAFLRLRNTLPVFTLGPFLV